MGVELHSTTQLLMHIGLGELRPRVPQNLHRRPEKQRPPDRFLSHQPLLAFNARACRMTGTVTRRWIKDLLVGTTWTLGLNHRVIDGSCNTPSARL